MAIPLQIGRFEASFGAFEADFCLRSLTPEVTAQPPRCSSPHLLVARRPRDARHGSRA